MGCLNLWEVLYHCHNRKQRQVNQISHLFNCIFGCVIIFSRLVKNNEYRQFLDFYGDIGHGVTKHIQTFIGNIERELVGITKTDCDGTTRSILEHYQTVHLVVQGLHDALLYLWNFV